MTVLSCVEIGGQRGGGSKGILDTDDVRVWRIETDDAAENSQTIGQQVVGSQIPTLYAVHPNYPIMTVREVKFTPAESEKLWFGVVNYSSVPITKEQVEREQYPNPLDRPVRKWGDSVQFQRAHYKDRDGNAITNTAGDPILGGVMVDEDRWVIHFEKNLDPDFPDWVFDYPNALNDDPVQLFGQECPQGTLKVSGLKFSEIKTENDVEYVTVNFDLHYRAEGWAVETLNYGKYQKVFIAPLGKYLRVRILTDEGFAVTEPQPLDDTGAYSPSTPDVYVESNVYTLRQFTGVLPLD